MLSKTKILSIVALLLTMSACCPKPQIVLVPAKLPKIPQEWTNPPAGQHYLDALQKLKESSLKTPE